MNEPPTERFVRDYVSNALGSHVVKVRRFDTGLCHYVFDIGLADQRLVVARFAGTGAAEMLCGGVFWHDKLVHSGVPVPRLLFADLNGAHPVMILERLPGTDLGNVYQSLDAFGKRRIAMAVAEIQRRVAKLRKAAGFGHACSYEDPRLHLYRTWRDFVYAILAKSRESIRRVGLVDAEIVEAVAERVASLDGYFASITATPFLDDMTTNNVLVNGSELSGVIDTDEVSFGDPWLVVGLTKMALLSMGAHTDYVEFWMEAGNANRAERRAVTAYAAIYGVVFLEEQGQKFNREQVLGDSDKVAHLQATVSGLLEEI